jgi:hypothetical protein
LKGGKVVASDLRRFSVPHNVIESRCTVDRSEQVDVYMGVCHSVVQYYRTMSDTDVGMYVEFEEENESSVSMSSQHKDAKTAEAQDIWPYKSCLFITCFGHKNTSRNEVHIVC